MIDLARKEQEKEANTLWISYTAAIINDARSMGRARRAERKLAEATAECHEQARLLGISAESETRWRARAENAERELDKLRAMVLEGLTEIGQTLCKLEKPEVDG